MSKNPYLPTISGFWGDFRCSRCNGGPRRNHFCQHCSTVERHVRGEVTRVSDWLRRKYGRPTKLQAQAVASAVLSHLQQERGQ